MSQTVNWGVLGASRFALNHMAPAIHAAGGARLRALATRDREKAAPFLSFCPDLNVFESYEALLADPSIDAVYIPLPNTLHVEWAEKAARAGKHVLCEKPIAMKAGDIDRLIALRDESGLLIAEAFMIVHHPQWQRARELFLDGAIGQPVLVDGVFSYDNRDDVDNIRNRPETGGGSLPDIGVYTFGGARWVMGEEPVEVEARIRRENGVDVFAHVTADFPSFRFSSVTSMRMFPRQEMAFHGEEGVMRLSCPFNAGVFGQAELSLERAGMTVVTERWPGINHYILQVENAVRTIREGVDYPWTLEQAQGTQRMIDMAFEAERPLP